MAKVHVEIPRALLELDKTIMRAVHEGINDCTDDLLRVASLRTPVDSTTLEKSGDSKVTKNGDNIVGMVSFKAVNRGYNYAQKMNDAKYNLGDKSKTKSSRGVRSKFTKSTMTVGTGYLTDTAEKCEKGYKDYINYEIYSILAKDGLKVKVKK